MKSLAIGRSPPTMIRRLGNDRQVEDEENFSSDKILESLITAFLN